MIIRLDPRELEVSSEVLRSCSTGLYEIGSSLSSCVVSPFPTDLEAATMALVRSVHDGLQRVAAEMGPMAADLQRRAAIAATDLNAAVSVMSPTSATTGVGQGIVSMTVAMPGAPRLPGDPVSMVRFDEWGLPVLPGAESTVMMTVAPLPTLPRRPGADGATMSSNGSARSPGGLSDAEAERYLEHFITGTLPSQNIRRIAEHRTASALLWTTPNRRDYEQIVGGPVSEPDYLLRFPYMEHFPMSR